MTTLVVVGVLAEAQHMTLGEHERVVSVAQIKNGQATRGLFISDYRATRSAMNHFDWPQIHQTLEFVVAKKRRLTPTHVGRIS